MAYNKQLAQSTEVATQSQLLDNGNAPLSKSPPTKQFLEERNAHLSEVEHHHKNNFHRKPGEQDGDHHDSNIHMKRPADKCQKGNEALKVENAQALELQKFHVSADQKSESSQVLDKLRKQQTNDDDEDVLEKSNEKLKALTKYVYFHKGVCCQWYYSKFYADGMWFTCTEQYMMYKKAELFKDWSCAKKILNTTNPNTMKWLGRGVKGFRPDIWMQHCLYIVKEGNILKFSQKARLKDNLYITFPKILVEASPHDSVWGIGLDEDNCKAWDERTWEGKNWLGYILTEVRDELMYRDGWIEENQCQKYLETLLQKEFESPLNTEPENSFNLENVNAGDSGLCEREKKQEIKSIGAGTNKEYISDKLQGGHEKSLGAHERLQGGHEMLPEVHKSSEEGHEWLHRGYERPHQGYERSYGNNYHSYGSNERSHVGKDKLYVGMDRSHGGHDRPQGGHERSQEGHAFKRSWGGHERSQEGHAFKRSQGGHEMLPEVHKNSEEGHEWLHRGYERPHQGYERSCGDNYHSYGSNEWSHVGKNKSYVGRHRSHGGHDRQQGGHERSQEGHAFKRSQGGHERPERGHEMLPEVHKSSEEGHEGLHRGYERPHQGYERSCGDNYHLFGTMDRSHVGKDKSPVGMDRSHGVHDRSQGGHDRSHGGHELSHGDNGQLGVDCDYVQYKDTSTSISNHLQSLSCKEDGFAGQHMSLTVNKVTTGRPSYAAVVAETPIKHDKNHGDYMIN